ncbi:acyltransferase family protein [Thaumasiovibrio sp. DFM-14]|uniref:acyltransferase family protein n=1 Tax=Thaumasiovibrio sp. DFM-14 TaxID=3384792 RepID=UPI0039A05134
MNKSRVFYIDFLRFVGLILIFLAHVEPPSLIFEIRNFDVSLMVFVSGLSCALVQKNKGFTLSFNYIYYRAQRLILPVWIFLTFYFIVRCFFNELIIQEVVTSYLMISGIGYVWFMRVLITFAIISPMIIYIEKKHGLFLVFILSLLGWLFNTLFFNIYGYNRLLDVIVFDWLGFIPLFALGLYINNIKSKMLVFITATLFMVIVSFYWFYGDLNFQFFKYPPRGIYIIYGVLVSAILYLLVTQFVFFYDGKNKLITFVSKNSMWIYLLHIPLIRHFVFVFDCWMERFIIVCILSVVMVYLKNIIVTIVEKKTNTKNWFLSALRG